ncbi:uncharacterized protein [Triticum aestivum]|uniref:uncharacterized protein n=1 Tax=Triticum aestivum TaxID=4565 RepID=UPI001D01E7F1|nr:uncharacterized protein LOC123069459 [Triticum aestivum]
MFYKNPLPFLPTSHAAHRACSVASPRTGGLLRRLLRRLAACSAGSPPASSPRHAPAASSPSSRRFSSFAQGDPEGRIPFFCKARGFPAPAAALMSWRELGLDLEAWKILELLVLELLLQTTSGCCGSQRRGEDDHGMGKTKTLLQPHATAPCSSCHCHFPPRAGGLMMEDPPSSLHRRRRCRFCLCFYCPLAHSSAAIGGRLGAEE